MEVRGSFASALVRAGTVAWALVGVALVLYALSHVVAAVSFVVTAFVLALFPAALLSPAASWFKARGTPPALAALVLLLSVLAALVVLGRFLVPVFESEVPALVEAAAGGFDRLEGWLETSSLPFDVGGLEAAVLGLFGGSEGELARSGLGAFSVIFDVVTGLLLGLVALFFVLKDGPRLWAGVADFVPSRFRSDVDEVAGVLWWTLGAYFRGQVMVALFDAVFIGLGLWVLGVPLAFPLAVVVFLGGLFPIVGAFVSGLLAVLVALADDGLGKALLVLALVAVVQQVEGNVLGPFILGRATALHPLLVVLSIAAGALWLGVLGAFLAVPVAASVARVVDFFRGRPPAAGPSDSEPDPLVADPSPPLGDGGSAPA